SHVLIRAILQITVKRMFHDGLERPKVKKITIQDFRIPLDSLSIGRASARHAQIRQSGHVAFRNLGTLAEDWMIVMARPHIDFMCQPSIVRCFEICEEIPEMLVLSGVKLVTAEPSEQSAETTPRGILAEQVV